MPLFQYSCRECGKESEVLVRGEEAPVCGHCGSKSLEKLASHFAAVSHSKPDATPCGAGQCAAFQNGQCCMN